MATEGGRKRGNDIGPTGRVLAFNIRRLRTGSGLDLRRLSDRLGVLGRSISASALSKIENCERRVEADDLMALAIALDVNPNALLLQPTALNGHFLELTGAIKVPAPAAWDWARGEASLRYLPSPADEPGVKSSPSEEQLALAGVRELERDKFRARVSPGAPEDPGPEVFRLVPVAPKDPRLRPSRTLEMQPVPRPASNG